MKVALVPLGDVPRDLLARLSDALADFGIACEIHAKMPLPEGAYDPTRGQYDADRLLSELEGGSSHVLGVTGEDLYSAGLKFVFGLAALETPRALMSYARLRASDPALFLTRLVKESVHEIGHSLGLPHCGTAGCVMQFSNSLAEADAKGTRFCDACRARTPVALGPGP